MIYNREMCQKEYDNFYEKHKKQIIIIVNYIVDEISKNLYHSAKEGKDKVHGWQQISMSRLNDSYNYYSDPFGPSPEDLKKTLVDLDVSIYKLGTDEIFEFGSKNDPSLLKYKVLLQLAEQGFSTFYSENGWLEVSF